MRLISAAAGATLLSLLCAGTASAGWSAPRPMGIPTSSAHVGPVAVNARGDAAIVWITRTSSGSTAFRTSVHVTTLEASGRARTRSVWSGRNIEAGEASVAIDRRREITVAWFSGARGAQNETVRAAYGSLPGHWAPARALGPGAETTRLAVAANGEVLLTFVKPKRTSDDYFSTVAEWRIPRHPFATRQVLSRPRAQEAEGGDPEDGPVPAFDALGAAYLWAPCYGVIRIAAPHTRHFGRPIVVTSEEANGFSLSVSGAGNGLAAWTRSGCPSAAGDGVGAVVIRPLRAGRFLAPRFPFGPEVFPGGLDVFAPHAHAVALPSGAGTVTWPARVGLGSTQITADGSLLPARSNADGIVPIAADGGGDQVIARSYFHGTPVMWLRPADGSPDQQSPAGDGELAVAAPLGRAVALAWSAAPGVTQLSVWRP